MIVLASQSPYRAAILREAGVRFVTLPPAGVDESDVSGADPGWVAWERSRVKAGAVFRDTRLSSLARESASTADPLYVLASDQVLAIGDMQLSKVDTVDAARDVLTQLQGQTHWLHTAYVLFLVHRDRPGAGRLVGGRVVSLPMTMRSLSPGEVAAYLATGEWRGSVGCYKFEGQGRSLFSAPPDDDSARMAIVGLPWLSVAEDLVRLAGACVDRSK